MRFTNEKSYIIVPNVAFGFGTEYHMTADEMMVYGYIQLAKSIGLENQLITMVDVIVESLGWNKTNMSRVRNRVVKALEGLCEKNYVSIESSGSDMKKSVLTITINKDMEQVEAESNVEWKENHFIWKGFTRVECNEYNMVDGNGQHLIVIAYTKWRENAKFDYKISFQEWAEVLSVSDKTARTIIEETEGYIEKISGGYYKDEQGQVKQEPNSYVVKAKSDVKVETKKQRKESILERIYSKITDERVLMDLDIFKQICDSKTKIRFEGYKIWRETDCDVVKQQGRTKFDKLRESGNGWLEEKLECQYQEYLRQKEYSQHMMAVGAENLTFESSYKKKDKDYYDFFED